MLDLDLIKKKLKEEVLLKDIAKEVGMSDRHFNRLLKGYELDITYKAHLLRKELVDYLSRNTIQKLVHESNINAKIFDSLSKREPVTYKALIRLLNFFDIGYSVKLTERNQEDVGKDWKWFEVEYPKKSEYEIKSKEVMEGRDKRGEELYSHLISSHMNKLSIVMRNQQLGMITQDRIKHIVLDIIRESINLGTIVERNQDKEIIDVLSKAIKQGKVLDIDKDVL